MPNQSAHTCFLLTSFVRSVALLTWACEISLNLLRLHGLDNVSPVMGVGYNPRETRRTSIKGSDFGTWKGTQRVLNSCYGDLFGGYELTPLASRI